MLPAMDERLDEQLNLVIEASLRMRRASPGEDRVRAASDLRDAAAVAEWLARDEAKNEDRARVQTHFHEHIAEQHERLLSHAEPQP